MIVEAEHSAGCPTFEISGFVQYMSNSPYIIAIILVAFGVTSTFFGGLLFDYVVATLAGIITFFVMAAVMDAIGGFAVLNDNVQTKAGNVFFAIFSILVALGAAGAAGWFVKKTSSIALGVLGCIGGFFIAVLTYGLVFAQFLTNPWFVWIFMILGAVGGFYVVFKFKKVIIVQLTAVVGAYSLIRGVSLVAGGFISEFTLLEQIKTQSFHLSGFFYLYLAAFVAIAVGGTFFQWSKDYHKSHINSDDNQEHYHEVK